MMLFRKFTAKRNGNGKQKITNTKIKYKVVNDEK